MAIAPEQSPQRRIIAADNADNDALSATALGEEEKDDQEYLCQASDFIAHSPDAILRVDAALCITHANLSAGRIFRQESRQLIGTNLGNLDARTAEGPGFIDHARRAFNNLNEVTVVISLAHAAGRQHYEVRLAPVVNGSISTHLFASMRNVSARLANTKKLDQALLEQETIFEGTAAGLFVSRNRIIVKVNRQLEAILGYASGEMIGMHSSAFRSTREESDAISNANWARMRVGESVRRQALFVRKDGSLFWAEIINRPLVPNRPEEGVIGVVIDISEQKAQEQELQRALTELNTIFDSTGVGLALVQEQIIVRCNRQLEQMLGFAPGELIGKSTRIICRDQAEFENFVPGSAAVLADSESSSYEQRLIRKDGREIWAAVTLKLASSDSSVPGFIVVGVDITERKRQDHQLQLALLELQTIFDGTGLGIMVMAGGLITRCNRQVETMLGYGPGELVGRHSQILNLAATELSNAGKNSSEAPESRPYMTRRDVLRRKDGSEVWAEITNRSIYLAGSPNENVVSVIVDITEKKRQEEQLQQALREQQQIFDTTLVGMAIIRNRRVVKGNAAAAKMLGMGVDELAGLSTRAFFACDEDYLAAGVMLYEKMDREGAAQTELPLLNPAGQVCWTSVHASAMSPGNPDAGYIVGLLDIQERKRAEHVLRETEVLLESIVENLPVMLSVKDADSLAYIRFNRAAELISGWKPGAAIGKTVFDLYPRFLAEGYMKSDLAAIAGRKPTRPLQEQLITGGGERRQIVTRSVPIIAGDGAVRYLMTIAEDVTEQRGAEMALRESEARFRQFADNVDQLFFITDPERTVCHYVNEAHAEIFGIPAEAARLNPRLFLDSIDVDYRDAALASFTADRQTAGTETEVLINHPTKGKRWVHSRTFPLTQDNGEIRVFGIAEDVTERRMREDARVQEAMQQRDVLVREVHHRIKNNLQGVAGLLQHAALTKPSLVGEINEVIGQIQAIAQVHGLQVREGGELSLLAMTQAIVDSQRRIGKAPFAFHNRITGGDVWNIPEQEAVPLALVTNELLTNALKYAAAGSEVAVTLSNFGEGVMWRVANAGRLPAGFNFATISAGAAGLSLVKALLPRKGASLAMIQKNEQVIAELILLPPVVRLSPIKAGTTT